MVQLKDPILQSAYAEAQLEKFSSKLSHLREQWEQQNSPAPEAEVNLLDEGTFTSELGEIKRYQLDSDHINDYIRGTLSPEKFDPGLLYVFHRELFISDSECKEGKTFSLCLSLARLHQEQHEGRKI